MKLLWIALALFASSALAADISGTWKGSAETENGTLERTFSFKVDGTKLTGETNSEMLGKSTIQDGQIEGDKLSFKINVKFQENEMTLTYNGQVTGDTMKLKVEIPNGGPSVEYVAKKVP